MPPPSRHHSVTSKEMVAAAEARLNRIEDAVLPRSRSRLAATKDLLIRSRARQAQTLSRIGSRLRFG